MWVHTITSPHSTRSSRINLTFFSHYEAQQSYLQVKCSSTSFCLTIGTVHSCTWRHFQAFFSPIIWVINVHKQMENSVHGVVDGSGGMAARLRHSDEPMECPDFCRRGQWHVCVHEWFPLQALDIATTLSSLVVCVVMFVLCTSKMGYLCIFNALI